MKPPSLRQLLEDPIYRSFIKTIPVLSPNLTNGNPWAVWARSTEGPWRGSNFPTYRDAWAVVVKALRNPGYEDVTIISRRQLFPPPIHFYWDYHYEWCSRCRRPTTFAIRPRHHALRSAPVMTLDDPYRCYYCGMRRCAMPEYRRKP
jgi:hypothetical protein